MSSAQDKCHVFKIFFGPPDLVSNFDLTMREYLIIVL